MGEWAGQWEGKTKPDLFHGPYILTIEKVEGTKVFGHGASKTSAGAVEFKFVGALQGNHLSFGKDPTVSLEIDGDAMKGTSQGGRAPTNITINKRK